MKNIPESVLIVALWAMVLACGSCDKESPQLQEVQEISVTPERLSLKVGETFQLTAVTVPDNAVVVWSSSASSIAAVSKGKVYAGAIPGTAVVAAQAGDKKATCVVEVTGEDELQYPFCHEVKVNIGIRTVTVYPSDKDPGPKYESMVQISGTIAGTAVMGRIEKIVSIPGYWSDLAQYSHVPVFTGSSGYQFRDPNDYSKIITELRCPLQAHIQRTEMDYVTVKEGDKTVEKYTKVYDFLATGKHDKEAISLSVEPYFPTIAIPPLTPHYVVALDVLTYTDRFGEKVLGNGHSLRWDYITESLKPTGNELYMSVIGGKTETDPEKGTTSPIVSAKTINDYFMNPSGGQLSLKLNGSSSQDDNGIITQRNVMINLYFNSIPNLLSIPSIDAPPPPLEDWDWE